MSSEAGKRFWIDDDGNAELGRHVRINGCFPSGVVMFLAVPQRPIKGTKKRDPITPWLGWLPLDKAESWVSYLNQADIGGLIDWSSGSDSAYLPNSPFIRD